MGKLYLRDLRQSDWIFPRWSEINSFKMHQWYCGYMNIGSWAQVSLYYLLPTFRFLICKTEITKLPYLRLLWMLYDLLQVEDLKECLTIFKCFVNGNYMYSLLCVYFLCVLLCTQSILNSNIHWKDWCWSWSSSTSATRCKEPIHWKRTWCQETSKAGGEGGNRGWDGWMASST